MPYPNEHACRLHDPDQYKRMRRENSWQTHDGKRIDAIWGVKDTEEGEKAELQAMRYPKGEWSADSARAHCGGKGGTFEAAGEAKAEEPAEDEGETYTCECLDCGHTLRAKQHCRDVECPQCGGTMRRLERPGPGQKSFDALRKKAVRRAESPNPRLKAKQAEDDAEGPGGFYGYLAVWNTVDLGGEVILPGAFSKSLTQHDTFPLMVRHALWGGDVSEIVGSFTAKEDDYGLFIDATYLDTPAAQETRQKTDRGIARGLSVGYREINVRRQQMDGRSVNALVEGALIEGTITIVPMNEQAIITATKSLTESRALEVLRAAHADGPGHEPAPEFRERAKELLGELDEARELLSGYLTPQPSTEAEDRLPDSGDVEMRRKRLHLAKAHARAVQINPS